ncbi:hypothetical protein ORM30_14355 [Bacillus cereus]|nr:hypothetical protein [Bacillus cereus]
MAFTSAGLNNNGITPYNHYIIQYDDTSFTNGLTLAQDLFQNCENDFLIMQNEWFGPEIQIATPITVRITPHVNASLCNGFTPSMNSACWDGINRIATIFVNDNASSVTSGTIRWLLVGEVTEMFMQSQGLLSQGTGWFGNGNEGSVGEGLSIFLSQQLALKQGLQVVFPNSFPANNWMKTSRTDYITSPNLSDPWGPSYTFEYAGCSLLFLYYLKDQLSFSIKDIIAAAKNNPNHNLAGIYQNLTGETDFSDFWKILQDNFPGQTPIPDAIYSPFPKLYPGWHRIGWPADNVDIGKNPDNTPICALNPENRSIWKWNGWNGTGTPDPNNWTPIGTPGNMFAATFNDFFGLAPDRKAVFRYRGNPGDWEPIGGPADAIFTDFINLYATNPDTGDLWKWNGTPFDWGDKPIGGPGSMWAGTFDNLFGLTPDKKAVFRYTGTHGNWEPIGGPADAIFTDLSNLYATNPDTGDLWKWNGTPFDWGDKPIGGPGSMFACSLYKLFGLSPDKKGIYRWSGVSGKWKKVGGPADAIFAGGSSFCALSPNIHDVWWNPDLAKI